MRQDNKELRRKLHDKLQDAVELESKIVPLREKIAALEEAKKTNAQKMANLEKRSSRERPFWERLSKIGIRPPRNSVKLPLS